MAILNTSVDLNSSQQNYYHTKNELPEPAEQPSICCTIFYSILRHDQKENTVLIKLRIELVDGSILHMKEYTDLYTRNYAFHWQQADDTWLVRWDNAHHFPKLASFPHHQHDYRTGEEIVNDSFDISLIEVLEYIDNLIAKPRK